MKKLFVIFLLMLFSILPCFAKYKPIPKELSSQYKADMEQIINNGYPNAIKTIDEYFNYVMENHYEPEVSIFDAPLFIYADMMKTTQEKYLGKKYIPYGTDSVTPASEFLYPYLKDNQVNIQKLKDIGNYAELKYNQIQKLIF